MSKLYAFGDIHGHVKPFQQLLDKLSPSAEDTVIILGDMINRGPDSKGVLDEVMALQTHCNTIVIMGNHEEMMLNSFENANELERWLYFGGRETLDSFGLSGDIDGLEQVPTPYIDFMKNLHNYHETAQHIFTHAIPDETVSLAQQSPYDWRWANPDLSNRYEHMSKKPVICGHVTQGAGIPWSEKGLIMIDTGIACNEWLTALDVDNMVAYQANTEHQIREMPLVLI